MVLFTEKQTHGHIDIKTTQIYAGITGKKVGEEAKGLEMSITKKDWGGFIFFLFFMLSL